MNLTSYNLDLKKFQRLVNRGQEVLQDKKFPSIVKAFYLVNKIDYYCFSFDDFNEKTEVKYENVPKLCEKLKVRKNLINPIYLS